MTPVGAFTNAVTWTTVAILRSTFFGNFLDRVVLLRSKFGLFAHLFAVKRPEDFRQGGPVSARNYYLENVAMMKSVCEGAKARFLWFPQPVLFLKQQKTATEEQMYKENVKLWSSLSEFYKTAIGHDAVARFGKAPFFHDLSDSLTLFQGTVYSDPFHYPPAAQDVIARRMRRLSSIGCDNQTKWRRLHPHLRRLVRPRRFGCLIVHSHSRARAGCADPRATHRVGKCNSGLQIGREI
jgi:hypothetical protein